MHRRQFHRHVAAAALTAAAAPAVHLARPLLGSEPESLPMIDTHQHLWDLDKQNVPWLKNSKSVLARSYVTKDYLEATQGLNIIQAIYMEVDLAPEDHVAEAELITALCRSPEHPTVAAVMGGHPARDGFASYARQMATNPYVKGIRQVLHGATPPGHCLTEPFVRSLQLLGELNLSFDICLRTNELADAVKLVDQCPDTLFIIDHCGNADPCAFLPASRRDGPPSHDPDTWRRTMDALGQREHVISKISGIVSRAPQPTWDADDLAPIVNHCLDAFGPDRVVFGSDWPVCRMGAELSEWVTALRAIVASRPVEEQRKLFTDNARRLYRLES
jgi:L-fuconolactonase